MRRIAFAALLLACLASEARADGEWFTIRWIDHYFCSDVDPGPQVRGGYLGIVSDTEWRLCPMLVLCSPFEPYTPVTGTTTRLGPRRAVFVGAFTAPFDGQTFVEADLSLDAKGEVKRIRGRFISTAELEGNHCASRGEFRTRKRTD